MAASGILQEVSEDPDTGIDYALLEEGALAAPMTDRMDEEAGDSRGCDSMVSDSVYAVYPLEKGAHAVCEAVSFPVPDSARAFSAPEEEGKVGAISTEPGKTARAAAEEEAAGACVVAGVARTPEPPTGSVPGANRKAALLSDEECLDVGGSERAHPEGMVALPSKGSVWHATGECRPCHHIVRSKRCKQGDKCGFCHFPEHVQRQQRPSKQKREQYRKLAQQMLEEVDANPEAYDHEQQALAPFLSQKIPKLFADNKQLMRKLNRRVQRQAWESAQKCPVGPDPWLPLDASPETWLQPMLEAGKLSQGGRIQQVGTWKVELLSF